MARIIISTKDMPREEWLEYRRLGIGGSDAGAIIGMNPYATPYSVWADKTGRLPEKEDNEAMRQGRDFEDYVAKRFEEKSGKRVRRYNYMLMHEQHDFITANIDRVVSGEYAGLECKTTSILNLKKFKDGEFPDQYYAQCVHYLAVTGWDRWYLGVVILGVGFKIYMLTRKKDDVCPDWCESMVYVDDGEIALLTGAEVEFWKTYVEPDKAPPVDGFKPTTDALSAIYQGGDYEIIALSEIDVIKGYLDVKSDIKALEKAKESYEQALKAKLGDCERGECGGYAVTWRTQQRNSFDFKRFAKENPEVDLSSYYSSTTYRVFGVKEVKN